MNNLSSMQAFNAMRFFLENYYKNTKADEVGSLLSSLELLPDGEPLDRAMLKEWAKGLKSDKNITIMDAFNAMIFFLEDYYNYIESNDIKVLLDLIRSPKEDHSDHIIREWKEATEKALNKD